MGGIQPGLETGQLFAGNGAAAGKRQAPAVIDLRAREFGSGAHQIGLAGHDLAVERGVVGLIAADPPFDIAQRRLRLFQLKPAVGVVNHHQYVAFADGLGVNHPHFFDGPAGQRGHLRGVGIDIGIVGGDVFGTDEGLIGAKAEADQRHAACERDEQFFARGLGAAARSGVRSSTVRD